MGEPFKHLPGKRFIHKVQYAELAPADPSQRKPSNEFDGSIWIG